MNYVPPELKRPKIERFKIELTRAEGDGLVGSLNATATARRSIAADRIVITPGAIKSHLLADFLRGRGDEA